MKYALAIVSLFILSACGQQKNNSMVMSDSVEAPKKETLASALDYIDKQCVEDASSREEMKKLIDLEKAVGVNLSLYGRLMFTTLLFDVELLSQTDSKFKALEENEFRQCNRMISIAILIVDGSY